MSKVVYKVKFQPSYIVVREETGADGTVTVAEQGTFQDDRQAQEYVQKAHAAECEAVRLEGRDDLPELAEKDDG